MHWPVGPWIIWVTAEGRLLVTEQAQPPPDPTAFPLAEAASNEQALADCLLIGCRSCRRGAIVVTGFCGRIGDVVALQHLLLERRKTGVVVCPDT